MRRSTIVTPLALILVACSHGPTPNESAATANETELVPADETAQDNAASGADAYLGRWTGVEGMYLVIGKGRAPGRYALEMQWDLDHKGRFEGTAQGDAIVFTRDGRREALRPTNGDETGLKYLAGKQDCLTVTPGEGYCRD